MQLDEQVTEGTKHRSIRVDMHGTYGVMALFKKKSGEKIKLEKIVIVMFF